MGVEVSSEDSATLPNDSLAVQLPCRSLPRLGVFLIINVDNPRYRLPSPPDVFSNDIVVSTSTSVSNGSGLPGCGPGLEPDRIVQFGLLPGKQGYPSGSGTGWNRTAVPYYGSCNFASN